MTEGYSGKRPERVHGSVRKITEGVYGVGDVWSTTVEVVRLRARSRGICVQGAPLRGRGWGTESFAQVKE